jgi:manganese transport protein
MSNPHWSAVVAEFLPGAEVLNSTKARYLAIGILGATVMPHNLFLHSSIVKPQTHVVLSLDRIRKLIKSSCVDTASTLTAAFFINAAILVMCDTTFHFTGNTHVESIEEAHTLLNSLLGSAATSVLL